MVNTAILKVLAAGATGVYMQQSGTAWTADAFREELDDGEFPMDPWINFVESADMLYTLGLEVFNSPDLCISRTNGSPEELRNILSVVADSIFVDGISSKSGTEVDIVVSLYVSFSKTSGLSIHKEFDIDFIFFLLCQNYI